MIYAHIENNKVIVTYPVNSNITIDGILVNSVPTDKIFREAWFIQGDSVVEDLTMSKEISHNIRRQRRDAEFEPLDRLATIPSQYEEVEAKRVLIREKYDLMQQQIDSSVTVQELKGVLTQ